LAGKGRRTKGGCHGRERLLLSVLSGFLLKLRCCFAFQLMMLLSSFASIYRVGERQHESFPEEKSKDHVAGACWPRWTINVLSDAFCSRKMGVQAVCPSCFSFLLPSPCPFRCFRVYTCTSGQLLPSDAASCMYIYIYNIPAHKVGFWLLPRACVHGRLPSHVLLLSLLRLILFAEL